jgi:hypothetical protein
MQRRRALSGPWPDSISRSVCRGSVIGHDSGKDGRCVWCGIKLEAPVPAPRGYPVSDLTEAYEMFYDPDWGAE